MSNNNNNNNFTYKNGMEDEMPELELLDQEEIPEQKPLTQTQPQPQPQPPKFEPKEPVKVIVLSREGIEAELTIPAKVVGNFGTILTILEDTEDAGYINENGIPLPGVSSAESVGVIIKYYIEKENHVSVIENADPFHAWEKSFFEREIGKGMHAEYAEIIQDSNYLGCEASKRAAIRLITEVIKDKNPDQVRSVLNITMDFTEDHEKRAMEKAIEMFEN